eukprot:3932375-Rhodomonas_salina.1
MDPVRDEDTEEEEEEGGDHQAGNTGGRGGSHQGMAKASDVLTSDKHLKQQHFMAKRANRGNCALCSATKPGKGGEKQHFLHYDFTACAGGKTFEQKWLLRQEIYKKVQSVPAYLVGKYVQPVQNHC